MNKALYDMLDDLGLSYERNGQMGAIIAGISNDYFITYESGSRLYVVSYRFGDIGEFTLDELEYWLVDEGFV